MNIGITGHRYLDDPTAWLWVEAEMSRALDALPPPLVAVTCLALGADQLLAKLVAARGGRVRAIIPFAGYERTFSREDLINYRAMLTGTETEVLCVPGTDEDAYLAAGHRVAALADLLFAVWDGKPARGRGGTADVVAFARQHLVPCVHLNPLTREVVGVNSPF